MIAGAIAVEVDEHIQLEQALFTGLLHPITVTIVPDAVSDTEIPLIAKVGGDVSITRTEGNHGHAILDHTIRVPGLGDAVRQGAGKNPDRQIAGRQVVDGVNTQGIGIVVGLTRIKDPIVIEIQIDPDTSKWQLIGILLAVGVRIEPDIIPNRTEECTVIEEVPAGHTRGEIDSNHVICGGTLYVELTGCTQRVGFLDDIKPGRNA